ncbi:MAG: hypothetical protein QM783_19825 [Phycisphaerales bacterium]
MSTTHSLPLLQNVRIASPCPMRWEDLTPTGDAHTRHCDRCHLNVHNLSGMSADDAESLLRSATNDDGTGKHRLCAAIFRRADGTVLTADCPVGIAALCAKARRTAARVAAAIGLTTVVSWAAARESSRLPFAQVQPLTAIANALRGQPVATPPSPMVLGDIGPSAPTPAGPVIKWLEGAKQ